ncbi:MAG: hypothetical protein VX500_03645, partial [Planctomycetota bacterium]|nr:hypothetical protein [Planctomycetota bacterium]
SRTVTLERPEPEHSEIAAWEQKSKCPWVSLYPSTSDDDQIHHNHASGQCLYPNSPLIHPN